MEMCRKRVYSPPSGTGYLNSNTPIWDDGRWAGLPALDSDLETGICVIGLGGSGLTCVTELLALGCRVAGIDAERIAAGAAGRNGGILRPGVAAFHHDAVRAIGRERAMRIHQLTLEEMDRMAGQLPGNVRRSGIVRIATSPEEHLDCLQQRDAMIADGLRAEEYSGPLGRGVFVPDGGSFQPVEHCQSLARRAVGAGALLFEHTRALSFTRSEVVTPLGRIRCSGVVVAVDGRLEILVPELMGAVRTARLQMLATAPVPEAAIPCPVSLNYAFDYLQQLPDGRIAMGGGRDRAMDDEWTDSSEPTPAIQDHLDRVLRDRFHVRAPVTHRWAANVSYSSSGMPVLAEVRPGVWAIGGYSGQGNLLGALAGRAAARAACGEPSEFASLLTQLPRER
jgi:gamma-glutamylputrescine oxidase